MNEQIKMDRATALDMVFNTKQKINKLLFRWEVGEPIGLFHNEFNSCIYKIGIWLDVYAASFNREIAVEPDEEKPVGKIEDIHNDNLKIDYRINLLVSVSARLIKYGQKATNREESHALVMALDHCKEAIGFLELIR